MKQMENITTVEVEIEGVAPLLMDRYHGLPEPKTSEGYKKQAEEKAYRDEKGNLAVPTNCIKAAMRLASSELGKKMMAKKNRQNIKAGVFFEKQFSTLGRKKHDGILEHVVTRGTGDKVTRVVTYRPHVKKWKVTGKMNVVQGFGIPLEFVQQALELGGLKYGLMGFRPEFGRFVVNKFEVVN